MAWYKGDRFKRFQKDMYEDAYADDMYYEDGYGFQPESEDSDGEFESFQGHRRFGFQDESEDVSDEEEDEQWWRGKPTKMQILEEQRRVMGDLITEMTNENFLTEAAATAGLQARTEAEQARKKQESLDRERLQMEQEHKTMIAPLTELQSQVTHMDKEPLQIVQEEVNNMKVLEVSHEDEPHETQLEETQPEHSADVKPVTDQLNSEPLQPQLELEQATLSETSLVEEPDEESWSKAESDVTAPVTELQSQDTDMDKVSHEDDPHEEQLEETQPEHLTELQSHDADMLKAKKKKKKLWNFLSCITAQQTEHQSPVAHEQEKKKEKKKKWWHRLIPKPLRR